MNNWAKDQFDSEQLNCIVNCELDLPHSATCLGLCISHIIWPCHMHLHWYCNLSNKEVKMDFSPPFVCSFTLWVFPSVCTYILWYLQLFDCLIHHALWLCFIKQVTVSWFGTLDVQLTDLERSLDPSWLLWSEWIKLFAWTDCSRVVLSVGLLHCYITKIAEVTTWLPVWI